MTILGIDPGTAITGYGVINNLANGFKLIDYGVIRTEAGSAPAVRLHRIFEAVSNLIDLHTPDSVAIEQLFFNTNSKTALAIGESRGVVFLASSLKGVPIEQYTPLQIKQAVVGYGRATKEQIQYMVQRLMSMDKVPKPDDAADALAVAICHANSFNLSKLKVL